MLYGSSVGAKCGSQMQELHVDTTTTTTTNNNNATNNSNDGNNNSNAINIEPLSISDIGETDKLVQPPPLVPNHIPPLSSEKILGIYLSLYITLCLSNL
jgi:hypothetical protein